MKGQYFSFDAIIASVIFVLAIVALLSYWHSVKSFLDYQNDDLSKDAIRVSNALFTPPDPSSHCADIERLGFAVSWDDRRMNLSTIYCAEGQSQQWLRNVTGVSYNLSIRIREANDYTELATIGGEVPDSASDVVIMRRIGTVVDDSDGSDLPVVVDVSIFQ